MRQTHLIPDPGNDGARLLALLATIALLTALLCIAPGCASYYLPVTGPLTSWSAGAAPDNVVTATSSGDGSPTVKVAPKVVSKDVGLLRALGHYALNIGEGFLYAKAVAEIEDLLDDDEPTPPQTAYNDGAGKIVVKGDATVHGRLDTVGQDVIIEGDLELVGSVNTAAAPSEE